LNKKYWRICPRCSEEILYSLKSNKNRAEKQKTNCKLCTMGSEETRKN
jgi:hypothetical protein